MHGGKKREQTRERKEGLGKKELYSPPPKKKENNYAAQEKAVHVINSDDIASTIYIHPNGDKVNTVLKFSEEFQIFFFGCS